MLTIEQMQEAARRIEIDGDEAFHAVAREYGEDVARLLLIAHLRRGLGSMTSGYPPPREIDGRVAEHLIQMGVQ